jgi:plasmid stabilization system protein ParE
MGRQWTSEEKQLDAMRVWPMIRWKCLIFYRPSESGIEIVRVLHGAQDVAAIIGDEEN